jgi:CheY-like chemotaxis protein
VVHRSILLIEDSDADSETTARVLSRCPSPPTLHRCADGDEAMQFLREQLIKEESISFCLPRVVLLDLNLPGTDGRHVLQLLKGDSDLRHIPVVILTTSADESDILFCYDNGASGYLTKPVNLDKFVKTVRNFYEYWFETVMLPK